MVIVGAGLCAGPVYYMCLDLTFAIVKNAGNIAVKIDAVKLHAAFF